MLVAFAPISDDVLADKHQWALASFSQCGQRTGCADQFAQAKFRGGDVDHDSLRWFAFTGLTATQDVGQATEDSEGDQTKYDQQANGDLFEHWGLFIPRMYN
jgi:hypothetical protein